MGRKLSALDNIFLQLERPTTPTHVGALLLFSGDRERVEARYARFRDTPVELAPFNYRLRRARLPGRRPSWTSLDSVPIDDHLYRHEVAGGGAPAALLEFIAGLHGPLMDRRRPMWECHMLDGLGDGRFGLYYRVHHALIDGVNAIKRLQEGLSRDPSSTTPPLWANEAPARAPRVRPPLGAQLRRTLTAAGSQARAMAELSRAMRELMARVGAGDAAATAPFSAPRTCINDMLSTRRTVAWQRLPLSEIRAIGKRAGATVNEVALAVSSTAVRNLLLRCGDLPDRPLVAMIPVALRDLAGTEEDGNAVSAIICNLATNVPDPLERFRAVVASSQEAKRFIRSMSAEAAAAFSLVANFPAIAAMLLGVYDRFWLPFNVVVSNVPGPDSPRYESGARLDAIVPVSMLWQREALNVTLISYDDHLDVGLVACAEAIPDLARVARELREAFVELRDAVLV